LFKDALSQIDGAMVFNFNEPSLALEHFPSNYKNYSVVITDYRMPRMTGIELLKKMKAISPAVTRILISAIVHSIYLGDHLICDSYSLLCRLVRGIRNAKIDFIN
jgi:DNA-binding NtrC family response regulator